MPFLHLIAASHAGGHRLHVAFDDGSEGTIDLSSELHGSVFEPLRDIDCFKSFQLNGSTLEWPNGADFAPEYLHSLLSGLSQLEIAS